MKGLIKKDWLHLRTTYMALLPYFLFMAVTSAVNAFGNGGIAFIAIPGMAIFQAVMPIVIIMDDQRTGYAYTTLTQPVSRRDIVTEKYLLALINAVISGAVFALITSAGALLGGNTLMPSISAGILISAVCLIGISVLPVMYIVRSGKMKMVYIAVLVGFGLIVSHIALKISASGGYTKEIVVDIGTSAEIFAVMLVLTAVSYIIAVRLYEKKDI